MMIEINLLPKEFRVKKRSKGAVSFTLPIIPIAVGVVALTFLVHAVMGAFIVAQVRKSSRLDKEWENLKPAKEKFDKMSSEMAEMEKAIKFVKKISGTEVNWFRLLGGLNEAVIPGVWLSKLSLESAGKAFNYKDMETYPTRLILTGHVLGKSEIATAGVARFINSLKAQQDFSGYFREIELIDMNSKAVSDEATMFFRLKCDFPRRAVDKKALQAKKKRR